MFWVSVCAKCNNKEGSLGYKFVTDPIKHVIEKLRNTQNIKIGLLKIVCFRPFPYRLVNTILSGKKSIGIIDRTAGLGSQGGPLYLEVKSALEKTFDGICNFIVGLGGRDVTEVTIEKIIQFLAKESSESSNYTKKIWIDTNQNLSKAKN